MKNAQPTKFVLTERRDWLRFFVIDTVDMFAPQPVVEKVIGRPGNLGEEIDKEYFSILSIELETVARAIVPVIYEAIDGRFLQIVAAFQSFDSAYEEFATDIKPGRMIVDALKGDDKPIIYAKKTDKNQITIDGIVVKSYIDIRQPVMK